jgi:hypothetical protein
VLQQTLKEHDGLLNPFVVKHMIHFFNSTWWSWELLLFNFSKEEDDEEEEEEESGLVSSIIILLG